jgi:hypothetical protein
MEEMSHMVAVLLSASGPTPTPRPTELQASTASPDLLTDITNALTAIAIVVGGAFAYLKFIKGRVLNASTLVEVHASVAPYLLPRQPASTGPRALLVEMIIRNNAQRTVKIPKNRAQLVYISSITEEELARAGQDLTQNAMSWKRPDAYYAEANLSLDDDGQPPSGDISLDPGGAMRLTAVFPIPSGHNAAAFRVVGYGWTVSRRWLRQRGGYTEGRTLVALGHESS